MPVYEFFCEICGPFEQWRDHRQASEPLLCPTCNTTARRVFSPPGLYRTSETTRMLLNRAERGAEPRVEQRPPPAEEPQPSKPRRGHGRPWAIEH